MKKNLKNGLFVVIMTTFVMLSSCKKDEVDPRDAFVGTYNMNQSWSMTYGGQIIESGSGTYTLSITKSSTDNSKLLFTPFGSFPSLIVSGTVSGSSFTITSQVVSYNNGMPSFSGSGSIQGTTLYLSWTATGYPYYDSSSQETYSVDFAATETGAKQ
jgi:hypothetical protein